MALKRTGSNMAAGSYGSNALGPLAVVASYTRFDNLAHGPRGQQAKNSMTVFRLNPSTGCLNKLYAGEPDVPNPAFLRWHPTVNVIYGCTEDVKQNGQIIAWSVDPESGALAKIDTADAQGILPLKPDGTFAAPKLTFVYDPKGSMGMQVSADKHVNHSENDAHAQAERQKDPHSHAIVLDPYKGVVAYVPDLGKDCIRELHYDSAAGKLAPLGIVPSGLKQNGPEGPRYIEFHAQLPVAYVVNELASEVAVFVVDRNAITDIARNGVNESTPRTLTYVQAVSTVPPKWKRSQNTCGRVVIHPSGRFVLCSNRGHDSVAVFRVELEAEIPGMLTLVGISHTVGMTPRHFKFDPSGQWLLAANQDSNSVATFNFNTASGEMTYNGMQHQIPSPNFVACFSCHETPELDGVVADLEEAKRKMRKTAFKLRGGSEAARGLGPMFTV